VGRIRIHHLQQAKSNGEHFAMLTAFEQFTAEIFDEAGIEVHPVGDSASNNVSGTETSLPVTVDELLPLCRAVSRGAMRALVVADLPFGSYEVSTQVAVAPGVRFLKEGLAHAVKIDVGGFYAETLRTVAQGWHTGDGAYRLRPAKRTCPWRPPSSEPGDDAQRLLMPQFPSRQSASVPGMRPRGRSSCCRTWPACAMERRLDSSSSMRTFGTHSATQPGPTARRSARGSSPAPSTSSKRSRTILAPD
jgi:hypothetical protein